MTTQQEAHAGPWSHYSGERGDWLIAYDYWTCDNAESLHRSNMVELTARLKAVPLEAWAVERSWVQVSGEIVRLLVNPDCHEAVKIAEEAAAELKDHPALNEDLWAEYEWDDAARVWEECYSWRDRLQALREHCWSGAGFRDLLAAVRGDAGAASMCYESFRELAY